MYVSENGPSTRGLPQGDLYMKSIFARSSNGVEQRYFLFTEHFREKYNTNDRENNTLQVRATDGVTAWASRPLQAQDLSQVDFGVDRIQVALEALTPRSCRFPSNRQFTYTMRETDDGGMHLGIHFTTGQAVARLRVPLTKSQTSLCDVQAALSTMLDNFRQLRQYSELLSGDVNDLEAALAAQEEVKASLYGLNHDARRQSVYSGIMDLLNARKITLNRLAHDR